MSWFWILPKHSHLFTSDDGLTAMRRFIGHWPPEDPYMLCGLRVEVVDYLAPDEYGMVNDWAARLLKYIREEYGNITARHAWELLSKQSRRGTEINYSVSVRGGERR